MLIMPCKNRTIEFHNGSPYPLCREREGKGKAKQFFIQPSVKFFSEP
jgi:hypothetical protein